MAKIRDISEIHPTLCFIEFDILEKYRKSFNESELGRFHSAFPFESMVKEAGLSEQRLGHRNFQSFGKDCSYDAEGLHRVLRQTTGGTS